MSDSFCITNTSNGNTLALASKTGQPKSFSQSANPLQGYNSCGNNATERVANNPNSTVTISIADLLDIKQRIVDRKKAAQLKFFCRFRSKSEPDSKRTATRSNLKGKVLHKYWKKKSSEARGIYSIMQTKFLYRQIILRKNTHRLYRLLSLYYTSDSIESVWTKALTLSSEWCNLECYKKETPLTVKRKTCAHLTSLQYVAKSRSMHQSDW